MKSRHRSTFSLSSPLVVVAVGVLCIAYIQLSDSAPTSESSSSSSTTSTTSGTKPTRITTLRSGKQRVENTAGRMKASDIKACISKAFCEVNSASRKPNYAVNQEFFDIMDQIRSLSNEDIDSGSVSVEYDEDEEEEDDDVESSEESSSERGYPGPPPPGYHRMGKKIKDGVNGTSSVDSARNSTVSAVKKSKGKKDGKKKMKVKTVKKYVNGTFISVPKRRHSRVETESEKAEKAAYLTRKQREMGQVNDLAALIRISADIGLTLRSPHKCRTLFNKCTMSHEQIVDLFNQTLMAVTTPASDNINANVVSTQTTRIKVHTTQASPVTEEQQGTEVSEITTASQAPSTTSASTTSSPTTTTIDNRNSKSRHDFSDEDVEYMTDTEIQPVATYALFVNDPVDDNMRTAETDVNVQDTFKKYANTFPAEASYPVDLPTLRKKSNKVSKSKKKKSSFNRKLMAHKHKASSEEEDEDDDEEEEDEPTSSSTESHKSGFRIESPYPGYRVEANKEEELEPESAEPTSMVKDSSEGILPPLVQKTEVKNSSKKPTTDDDEEVDEDEENDEESEESVEENIEQRAVKPLNKKYKKKAVEPASPAPVEEEESSEEDDVETADDIEPADDDQQSAPPPWTPVYQRYMNQKQKQGYKKKQKGPYKGGEHPYDDSPHVASSANKPWAGGASHELGNVAASSHESMYGDSPYHGHPPPYEVGAEKPGFFQSIMSWFTGGSKTGEQSPDGHYPPQPMAQHQHQHPYSQESPTGAPWPSQPDPGHVGHYQYEQHPHHQHAPSQYRHRDSSEDSDEDEEAEVEEFLPKKKSKKNKRRRYRGRSDSIINAELKKPASSSRKTGPPAPVVVVPKENKPNGSSGSNSGVGVYEPNSHYDTLIKADGGITAGSNLKGKNSGKENKRTKKAAIKPKQKKKNQKQSQRAHGSNESHDDDDEAYSSEELFNKQVQKLKSEKVGTTNSASSNNGKQNNNEASATTETSFPKYFESMFGNEKKKDPFKPSGKDDGSLLYGFDLLSSTLSATPMDLPALPKKKGTYTINKTKKKKKGTSPPVQFNQKEVINSSEENEEKKKK
ncbi:hypothetical protein Ocin01_13284 [Orchesella cincta]|uniref:Uncharacterized protein n=1 Tax=Orchesella cincta TaxID=48709 RepID=A0A1D2MK93_ORCCI|nr:hypothetical protein Ocin01_13284 [Orchesella cincta]